MVRFVVQSILAVSVLASTFSQGEAQSSFKPVEVQPLGRFTALECVVVKQTDDDDDDPIYKISVQLTLNDQAKATDLVVVHHARSGRRYNRADQYVNASLQQTSGKTEYIWSGQWTKRMTKRMRGTLVRTADGRWLYSEAVSENGRLEYEMLSTCQFP